MSSPSLSSRLRPSRGSDAMYGLDGRRIALDREGQGERLGSRTPPHPGTVLSLSQRPSSSSGRAGRGEGRSWHTWAPGSIWSSYWENGLGSSFAVPSWLPRPGHSCRGHIKNFLVIGLLVVIVTALAMAIDWNENPLSSAISKQGQQDVSVLGAVQSETYSEPQARVNIDQSASIPVHTPAQDHSIEDSYLEIADLRHEIEVLQSSMASLKETITQQDDLIRQAVLENKQSTPQIVAEVKSAVMAELQVVQPETDGEVYDYALRSQGGKVLNGESSWSHREHFMSHLWKRTTRHNKMLTSSMDPGECWPMDGTKGHAVIKLSKKIQVVSVAIEHVPRSLACPGKRDDEECVCSAPKDFIVYAQETPNATGSKLLEGTYRVVPERPARQTFFVENQSLQPVDLIRLTIKSNHGNPDYTCVYRFMVHGRPVDMAHEEQPQEQTTV